MNGRCKLAAFLFGAFAICGHAFAAPIKLYWCTGCTAIAKKNLAAIQPIGTTVYVGDTTSGAVVAYYDDQGWTETQPAHSYTLATPITPVSPYTTKIAALVQLYHMGTPGFQKAGNFSYPSNTINVYNVVNPGPDEVDLANWMGQQPGAIPGSILSTLGQLSVYIQMAVPATYPTIDFTITFFDGSTIHLSVALGASNPEYKVVPNSGIDSHHNHVLSSPQNTPYIFDFSNNGNPTDYSNWYLQMTLLNYNIPTVPGVIWACTNSAAGYHCVHPL